MSDRHQTAGRAAKAERRVKHHRQRQALREALHVCNLEDLLDPPSVQNTAKPGRPEPVTARRRRLRHWKQPFWKRRSQGRRDRNKTIAHLNDD
jgi:hypothetical protein